MSRDGTTLADVVNAIGHIYRNTRASREVLAALEKRWQREEHPLMLLGFALHPMSMSTFRQILRAWQSNGIRTPYSDRGVLILVC